MRRTWIILLLVTAVAVCAFAAGNAAPKLKFPWAGEELNKPAKMTELERRCLAARINTKPVKLKNYFDLVGFRAEARKNELLVRVDFVPKKGIRLTKERAPGLIADLINYYTRGYIHKHICPTNDDFRHLEIRAYYKGKPMAKRDVDGFKMLAKF